MTRILIVDDEKSIRVTLPEFLRDDGYAADSVDCSGEALRLLEATYFDVLVTDIILPAVTGIMLLATVKKHWPNLPVILMTGQPTLATATEAVRGQAFDYLTKPFDKEALLEVVRRASTVRRMADERAALIGQVLSAAQALSIERSALDLNLAARTPADGDAASRYSENSRGSAWRAANQDAGKPHLENSLTGRELQIIELLKLRMRNKEIASELHIAPGTVKRHLENVAKKLRVNGRQELVDAARQLGLVT